MLASVADIETALSRQLVFAGMLVFLNLAILFFICLRKAQFFVF